MAMDFFAHQEVARKKTGLLVFLFGLAITAIAIGTYLVVAGFVATSRGRPGVLWEPALFAPIGLGVLAVVAIGSLYRIASLRSGGMAVAELLGARRVEPGSANADERRLLNVVEEMAIASGTPVPPVYVMDDESAINAFAAGYDARDAVVAVTRGTLTELSRDELQGVVAHEFSHILNGDMRLNIRLMGCLHGITVIGMIGYMILRSGRHGRTRRDKSGAGQLVVLGIGLWTLGSLGTFFANLIKAAVSRQREYLADSSAVQFTRNPSGIAGALTKIAGLGSRLESARAPEVGHMLFGQGVANWLGRLGATHPPIEARIRRIDPDFGPDFARTRQDGGVPLRAKNRAGPATPTPAAPASVASAAPPADVPESAIDTIGRPSERHVEYAERLIAELPAELVAAARDAFGARALIYALLLAQNEGARSLQLERLASDADPTVRTQTLTLASAATRIDARGRLPLLDLAMPALRQLSPRQYRAFQATVQHLLRCIEEPSVFQWTLGTVLRHNFLRSFEEIRPRAVRHTTLARLKQPAAVLLSILSHAGHGRLDQARPAFEAGAGGIGLTGLELLPAQETGLGVLSDALRLLDEGAPPLKKRLLEACARTIAFDREITVAEGELFRAIADSLGCPVPPLLPGQSLT